MKNKLLSIILPSFYSGIKIERNYFIYKEILEKECIDFEFIIIDDGSKDNSFQIAQALEIKYENVKAFQLSKNYSSHYAIFAGISKCSGSCAVPIADDFQLPVETVIRMYRLWEKGHNLIIPQRKSRKDGVFSDMFSNLYYNVMNMFSDVKFPKGGADVFFADREILDILNNNIHPINTSTIVEVLRLGFDPYYVLFDRPKSKGESRWTFKKKLRLAKDTFFSCSTFPIRLISFIGMIFFVLSLISIPIYVVMKLKNLDTLLGFSIPGWTSIIILLSFSSGLILLSLSVIAEYIWRIYEEVKGRPGYIIKRKYEEKNEYIK